MMRVLFIRSRQLAFSEPEADQTRIITYLFDLEIPAADYLGGPGDVSPIDALSIETILQNALPGQVQLLEEVQSYLESECRKTGCERSDASGYRYVWENVPEPGTLSLLGLAAAALMWRRHKHRPRPEPSLLDQERERLQKLPKEQQEALAREVRGRYPNLFALADKLQAEPQDRVDEM